MLFHFRVPRTRPWDKYLKKLKAMLDKDDKIAHISAMFTTANSLRTPFVKLLDACAKDSNVRSDELIDLLEKYLPSLELLYETVKACNVKLNGYLDIVWTSFMTVGVNKKSLSYDLQWERAMAYTVLGLAHYCKAQELHHENRGQSKKKKDEDDENKEEYDPVFDEAPKNDKIKIYDDKETIKQISINLKKAGSVWLYISKECYPVKIEAKQYDTIPESFRDILTSLSNMSMANAQEFMVQLCVQTNKSKGLTSKLAMGVSKKLNETSKLIKNNLGKAYNDVRLDYKLYLSIRARLYLSIGYKYYAQEMKDKEKYGDCVAYFKVALNTLNKVTGFPEKKEKYTTTMNVMKKSILQQKNQIKSLLKDAQSDNDNVYYEAVPKTVESPPSKWAMKVDKYEGYKDL